MVAAPAAASAAFLHRSGDGRLVSSGGKSEVTGDLGNDYGHYAWSSRVAVGRSR